MVKIYISKVLSILGGFRSQDEVKQTESAFYRGLSPMQAAQVIINQRL